MDLLSKIITLANAGYTRDEISALMSAQAPVDPPVQQTTVDPPVQQTPVGNTVQQAPSNDAIMKELAAIKQAVQIGNIFQAQQPQTQQTPTAQDVLASIIAPPKK